MIVISILYIFIRLIFIYPGRIFLWIGYMFPMKGTLFTSARHKKSKIFEVLYSILFWLFVIALVLGVTRDGAG